ncbi:hypothetical protein [Sphingomonas sp.]|uniref:hypothetical protein n=1 Tax=Sphingomonas sp. TaxID=28214 RepID=UPI002E374C38|nr:hypothetical protein [Sphingomonas sp.]HEX4693389.1 hypothetical protein [Sphingomonas sp.]
MFHQKFGYGEIAEIESNKIEIDFETAGRKRVIDSFVTVGLSSKLQLPYALRALFFIRREWLIFSISRNNEQRQ